MWGQVEWIAWRIKCSTKISLKVIIVKYDKDQYFYSRSNSTYLKRGKVIYLKPESICKYINR